MCEPMLTLAPIFSDDMVLQQNTPLPVWGTAEPGAAVCCTLRGHTVHTAADAAGRWQLTLPALPAGGPETLTVQSKGETLCRKRVWLGEVWLAGGQSNMELELQNSEDGKAVLAQCADPRLHFFAVPKVTTPEAMAEQQPRWQVVGPDTAATMSAVAYYAAKRMAQSLEEVHIGVVCCYWGGTFAHCWLPRAELETFPEGRKRIEEYNARMGEKSDAQFAEECAQYQQQVDDWNAHIAACREKDPEVPWSTLNEVCGLFPWPPPAGRTGYQRPGNLYDAMLSSVCPYAIKGFWYYQGEQDEEHAGEYRVLLTHLVRRWRADWGKTLPFLIVQLPMFGSDFDWPALRAAQSAVARTEPNCGLVVLADCGEQDNIHPTDKKTPGTRLGLLTLQKVYGQPVQGIAPRMTCADCSGDQVLLRFSDTAGVLSLASQDSGFELAGSDGVFYPAKVEILEPDTVRLSCSDIRYPQKVRYAWHSFGPAALVGGTGLPAEPFYKEM